MERTISFRLNLFLYIFAEEAKSTSLYLINGKVLKPAEIDSSYSKWELNDKL